MYQNPIAKAGTGTLIGGRPNSMMYVADPQTCFNDNYELPVQLRRIDHIELPDIAKTIKVEGGVNADLLNVLGTGEAPIRAGVGFNKVQTIELSFEDVQLEYLDSVAIKYYYDNVMDETCKDFLDQVGFIIQAIKVGKMRFVFTDKNGAKIELSTPVIEDILRLGVDIEYSIENRYSLIIETPKYLGYQLGQLRKSDNGYTLYRASTTKKNQYVFKSINVFQGGKSWGVATQYSSGYRYRASEASIVKQSIYLD